MYMIGIKLLTKHSSGQVVSQITMISYLTTIELIIACMHITTFISVTQCVLLWTLK